MSQWNNCPICGGEIQHKEEGYDQNYHDELTCTCGYRLVFEPVTRWYNGRTVYVERWLVSKKLHPNGIDPNGDICLGSAWFERSSNGCKLTVFVPYRGISTPFQSTKIMSYSELDRLLDFLAFA